jgi:hypothetical protein
VLNFAKIGYLVLNGNGYTNHNDNNIKLAKSTHNLKTLRHLAFSIPEI